MKLVRWEFLYMYMTGIVGQADSYVCTYVTLLMKRDMANDSSLC